MSVPPVSTAPETPTEGKQRNFAKTLRLTSEQLVRITHCFPFMEGLS